MYKTWTSVFYLFDIKGELNVRFGTIEKRLGFNQDITYRISGENVLIHSSMVEKSPRDLAEKINGFNIPATKKQQLVNRIKQLLDEQKIKDLLQ